MIRCYLSQNAYLKGCEVCREGRKWPFAVNRQYKGKFKLESTINKFLTVPSLVLAEYDIFHPTYYDPYFLKFTSKKLVVTVYDMIHEIFPQYFPAKDHTAEHKKILLAKANKIIAISENTKRDLLHFYPSIDKDKIEVIHLCSSHLVPGTEGSIKYPERYILFVGQRSIYKNFLLFLKAVAEIINKQSDLFLVCAGGGPWSSEERSFLKELGIEAKVHLHSVNDSQLALLYSKAICFVFPIK
jgi:glycosyltransferase involved in cell wall biosynthesis